MRQLILIICCCVICLTSCQPTIKPQGLEVTVDRVVSGQTIEVSGSGLQTAQVRLIGIDAPDLQQQPWGQAARTELQKMIANKPAILEFDLQTKDALKRQLAYVWQNQLLLNEQIVKAGWALFAPRSPNQKYDQRLERAQERARLMGQGIWNPEQPMRLTPSEFRRQNR